MLETPKSEALTLLLDSATAYSFIINVTSSYSGAKLVWFLPVTVPQWITMYLRRPRIDAHEFLRLRITKTG